MWAMAVVAMVAGAGAYGVWAALRSLGRERRTLLQLRARRPDAEVLANGSVVVLHRGLPVTVGFDVPADREWSRGLVASANYVLGTGPRFEAAPTDITAHTRPANGASLLRARFEHLYELTGDHREVRSHLLSVLERTDSSELPAPLFSASHTTVRVYLPEHVPDADDPRSQDRLTQLIALTGELAHFGADALARYAEVLDGRMAFEPDVEKDGGSLLVARFDALGRPGLLELRWAPVGDDAGFRFQLQLSIDREGPSEPNLAAAIRTLDDLAERVTATRVLTRAELTSSSERMQLTLGALPSPDELPLLVRMLRRMAGEGSADAPFR